MIFLGNDIVYLNDPLWKEERLERWCQKVCTQEEKELIFQSQYPGLTARRIWSCKESAWKVLIKSGAPDFRNPKKLSLIPKQSVEHSEFSFRYQFEKGMGWGKSFLKKEYAYALSANQPLEELKFYSQVFTIPEKKDQSQTVRQLLLEDIFQRTGWKDISIRKDGKGIPRINGLPNGFALDLSFTHHFPFGAYLFCEI